MGPFNAIQQPHGLRAVDHKAEMFYLCSYLSSWVLSHLSLKFRPSTPFPEQANERKPDVGTAVAMARRNTHADWGDFLSPANEPALVCREKLIEQPYHYWRGTSGERYLHSVYTLLDCPALPKATYIMVRRDRNGSRRPLHIGQTVEDTHSLNLAHLRHLGAQLGANEVHIHLLAETAEKRVAVEADLSARQFGRMRPSPNISPANDAASVPTS